MKIITTSTNQYVNNKKALELHCDIKDIFIEALGVDNVRSVGTTRENVVQLRLKVDIVSIEQAKLIASLLKGGF